PPRCRSRLAHLEHRRQHQAHHRCDRTRRGPAMNSMISNASGHLWLRLSLLGMAACLVAGVVWVGASTRNDNNSPTIHGEATSSAPVTDVAVAHVAPKTAPEDGVVIPTGT